MTILVTGGAGFIGSNFVLDWLAGRDEPVVDLDALTYAGISENLASLAADARHVFVHGDICDRALVDALLARHRPRAIVHFAAETHVDRSIADPAAFMATNVQGTFNLLETTRAHWSRLAGDERARFRFLHVSTDEVFGSLGPAEPAFTESHPCQPNNPYAASKAASDQLVRAWFHTYGLPVLTTRCCNNYGPRQLREKLIPLMLSHALAGQPLPLYGDGLHTRDWLYVQDHAQALHAVLERGQPGATYNIGARSELTNREVVRRLCALLDELRPDPAGPHSRLITHVPDRPGHDRRYAIDPGKIERELGWRPSETFESGLRKTVQWFLA